MKNECNIVKDLLPLYIDGAVSEDSRQLVEEHTAICEDCSKERREMMLALPENQEPQKEQAVLQKAAKKLRRKHMRRGGQLAILGLLLGILLAFGGSALYTYLRHEYCVPIGLEDYEIRLSYLENGWVIMSFLQSGKDVTWDYSGGPSEDGEKWILNIEATTPHLPKKDPPPYAFRGISFYYRYQNGKIYAGHDSQTQVTTITRTGVHGETEVLYEYGVDESRLLPASEQMEEYFRLYEIADLYDDLRYAGDMLWDVIDESALPFTRAQIKQDRDDTLRNELYARAQEAEALVPEWQ